MTATPYEALGEPVLMIDEDLFAVTYPHAITQQVAELLKQRWAEMVGPTKRLIVLDSGATITRLGATMPAEPTPIYDALVAERQAS